jgi:hypothetical protein
MSLNAPPGTPAPAASAGLDAHRRPLSRRWRWAIAAYALFIAVGIAGALLMSHGPGSGRLAALVAVLMQPYLQMADVYRGQDPATDEVEYVVYESEDEAHQGLRAFLQGRQDMRYLGRGLLPGVSVVSIRKNDLRRSLDELNEQPFVHLVLKARVGMICH